MECITRKVQHDYSKAALIARLLRCVYERPLHPYRCPDCGAWHVGSTTHKPQPMRLIQNNHELRMT